MQIRWFSNKTFLTYWKPDIRRSNPSICRWSSQQYTHRLLKIKAAGLQCQLPLMDVQSNFNPFVGSAGSKEIFLMSLSDLKFDELLPALVRFQLNLALAGGFNVDSEQVTFCRNFQLSRKLFSHQQLFWGLKKRMEAGPGNDVASEKMCSFSIWKRHIQFLPVEDLWMLQNSTKPYFLYS